MTELRRTKVSIVGAGSVGATAAFASQIRGVAHTIAIYDLNGAKTRAEVLDMQHGSPFTPPVQVIGSDDIAVTRGSDIVVVTAGARQKPGQTRVDLIGVNVSIFKSLIPNLLEQSPNATFVIVSNPCDILTYAALKISGAPQNKIMGSGTVLDSARLRSLIASYTGIAPQNVHAYIAGEHGDTEIALWSSASIAGIPLEHWGDDVHLPLTPDVRKKIHHDVVNAAYEIIQGKGATWYAVGLAITRICEAILKDENRVMPVSSLLTDYYGISDVVLAVPSIVNHMGVEKVLQVPLSDEELQGLTKSGDTLREIARSVGL